MRFRTRLSRCHRLTSSLSHSPGISSSIAVLLDVQSFFSFGLNPHACSLRLRHLLIVYKLIFPQSFHVLEVVEVLPSIREGRPLTRRMFVVLAAGPNRASTQSFVPHDRAASIAAWSVEDGCNVVFRESRKSWEGSWEHLRRAFTISAPFESAS